MALDFELAISAFESNPSTEILKRVQDDSFGDRLTFAVELYFTLLRSAFCVLRSAFCV